jgi:hypothetical protein
MSGRPATGRCEKHDRIRCLQCWKDTENMAGPPKLNASQVPTDSVRSRLSAGQPMPVVLPKPGTPPPDIEGFDAGGPPNVVSSQVEPKPETFQQTGELKSTSAIVTPPVLQETSEIADFVAAARRRAIAGQNLAALEKAVKLARAEKKVAYAEFKRLMNPPRARKPRKAKSSLVDSKIE